MSSRVFTLRRLIWSSLGLAALSATLTALLAPQVPLLLREGFPRPAWPAPGHFAPVQGVDILVPPAHRPLPDAAQRRFDATGGRALLMSRSGRLIHAHYAKGLTEQTRLNSYSLVKTLVGALTLRAIADGRIPDLATPLSDIYPSAPRTLTVEAVLTMRSGLALSGTPPKTDVSKSLDDRAYSPFGPMARLHAFGLTRTLPELHLDPDQQGQFTYQSANTALLGAMLAHVYGRPLPDLLSEMIWTPAGAATAQWRQYPRDPAVSAYCCLYARPLDWLRVGEYLLRNGTPNDPFLPPDLWHQLVRPDLDADVRRQGHYGLHIRHDVLDRNGEDVSGPFAYLLGHSGQILYLLPDQDTVVVRFGATPQRLHSTLYELWPAPE